ncbi:MAG TPA: 2Fe-2S iron-sulfur cluster-binding protein [Xanthobacteraceae bacterium]|nr:2Fe-2S iron-sulfur cluster-binding protein [Xanthobacteraceae bacterium]
MPTVAQAVAPKAVQNQAQKAAPRAVHVTLGRTGKSFAVNPGETILDAALRQEIWLPHACRGGTCGSCKAIVVSGAVTYDGAAPAAAGQTASPTETLLCCAKALGDVTLDVAELAARPIGTMYRRPARVLDIRKPSRDVAIVTLKPPPNAAIRFRPGQYICLIGDDGRLHPFSIANAQRADGTLDLHIGRVPNGRFTGHVHERMRPRDIVRFEGPFGEFGFSNTADAPRPAILLAGGTGIAPIKAMLEAAEQASINRDLHLYWGSRRREGLYALDEIAAKPLVGVTPVLLEPPASDAWRGRTGLVHRAVMEDFPDLSPFDIYACGSPGLTDAAFLDFTRHARLPPDRFFANAFHNAGTVPHVVSAAG